MLDHKLNLAGKARASERYDEAHWLLIDCLESAASTGDAPTTAAALLAFATNVLEWCPEGSDPFESKALAAEGALTIYRAIGDFKGQALALLVLATAGRDRARELDEAALAIGRSIGDGCIIARALSHLGCGASIDGQNEKAVRNAEEAVKYAEQSGDTELVVDTLFTLGVVAERRAKLDAFTKMASLEAGCPRRRRFARRLSAAASLIGEDDPDLAAEWFNRCVAIAREISDERVEGDALRGLAFTERLRGNNARSDELRALADVLCPLPKTTKLVEAVRTLDMRSVDAAVRAMFVKSAEHPTQ